MLHTNKLNFPLLRSNTSPKRDHYHIFVFGEHIDVLGGWGVLLGEVRRARGGRCTENKAHAQNPSSAARRLCIPTLVISNPGHVRTHRTLLPVGAPTGKGEGRG